MQTRKIAAITILALPLAFGGYTRLTLAHAQPRLGVAASPADDDHDRNHEAREQGRHDGMQAAHEDMRNGRHPDADHHDQYRHPPVDKHARDDYRAGFRDGYNDAIRNGQNQGYRDQGDHHDDDRH